ncbi:diguanylate cyclase [Chitinasiproducens palmae]|nr:diguanylate cyclase [Chitinasiproducens palmae]
MPTSQFLSESQAAAEWRELIAQTRPAARAVLAAAADEQLPGLADLFYEHMLADPHASMFISNEQVRDRLHASLQRWLAAVLTAAADDMNGLIALQRMVGDVHARIGIPVNLVARATRRLKRALYDALIARMPPSDDRSSALIYVSQATDIALEVMTASYSRSREQSAKTDEAYRLFSVMQNVGTERERQRAALLDWENAFVYRIAINAQLDELQKMAASDFGLWFHHKGQPAFGDSREAQSVARLIVEIDEAMDAAMAAAAVPQSVEPMAARIALLNLVRDAVGQLKYLLGALFEQIAELETGRDALTHLLNRRFIPTVLRREVVLAAQSRTTFSVLMVDIDHFKAINDQYGHDAGDLALQTVAALLVHNVRGSDYAFRYGGEEFLLVLVETTESQARTIAESLRKRVEQETISSKSGEGIKVTISIGLAMHTGHPDYERTISAADEALYRAKKNGRNRTECAF